ncbi:family pyridoxal phosphate enzyme [Diplodia corticola]|uniref:Pyridoxal phosphate homeostasis protein n=1 Tax=Diplodia corticola TaxID=236234 RepID=A0A1J9RMU4_9PEZI|nr:family pyridoxal phosphate enzyme [Diplodia corticola]OJD28925.1 family pyridoxal phosphate enzyme [Diplodia corticola]
MADHDMKVNPLRATELIENIAHVSDRIRAANKAGRNVRLIAVSKLKPATDVLALHTAPAPSTQLHFGENYFQELQEKAAILPRTIRWHFIGALQTNKCSKLAEQIPNLWCVSSVDSAKKADQLEKGRKTLVEKKMQEGAHAHVKELLRIMVQVNTSGEEAKSGVEPQDTAALCRHVREHCPHLKLAGLMTIGAIARSQATTPETENEDFVALRDVRDKVVKELGLGAGELELSMGMSSDFEGAIALGSDEVRVGTTIFGVRPPKKDAKVKGDVDEAKE